MNSSILVLLVKPSICYCHAGEAVLVISPLTTHTHTHTHTHTAEDCVLTPGLDLKADGIPESLIPQISLSNLPKG